MNDLKKLRKISVTMSVASFLRYIIDAKGIIAFINALGNGEQRYQNILKLISVAEKFDKGVNVGLTAFIRYIDKIASSDKGIDSAPLNASDENAVSIMSVHHSKGLEFPICIYAGASKQYNKQDLNDKLLLNTKAGIGIKYHNEEEMYQYSTIPYAVIKSKNADELMSENLRVLYVAMTRAKEQFITFITVDNLENKLKKLSGGINNNGISPYVCKHINCDGDLLLSCALMHKDSEILRENLSSQIKIADSDFDLSVEIKEKEEREKVEQAAEFSPADKTIISEIEKNLSYKYERSTLSSLSSKLTASTLDNKSDDFSFLTSSKPAFLNKGGLSPAQRGTAMHTFMQFCNYDNAENNLEKEITHLTQAGYLDFDQAQSLDREGLGKFFKSGLYGEISSADKLHREIMVSSFVSARDIYGVDFDDKILVQGIADCVIEKNGALTLIDYKTDNVKNEAELLERYEKQIEFYESAVSKTLGLPVKSVLLYSFKLNKCCRYK